jgi:hypothetical protein
MERSSGIATVDVDEKKEPVKDNASSHLRNARQIIVGVRAVGFVGDAHDSSKDHFVVTVDELNGIEARIVSALADIERDATERRGILAMMQDRVGGTGDATANAHGANAWERGERS